MLINKCRVGTTHCQLGKARRNRQGVVGGRFRGLLGGHSSPPMEMRATSTYRTIDSHVLRSSKLATTRILVCQFATARLLCFHSSFRFSGFRSSSCILIFRVPLLRIFLFLFELSTHFSSFSRSYHLLLFPLQVTTSYPMLENSDFRLLTTCILSFLHKAKHIYAIVNTIVASTGFHHS